MANLIGGGRRLFCTGDYPVVSGVAKQWLLLYKTVNMSFTMFTASLREGVVPHGWKRANVVPIPKIHPPTAIYLRQISFTTTLSKVLESFIGR